MHAGQKPSPIAPFYEPGGDWTYVEAHLDGDPAATFVVGVPTLATTNGSPAYFRIQAPTLVIEYAPQGGSTDHIHTIYRDPTNDYGVKIARR